MTMASIFVNGTVNNAAFCIDLELNEMDLYRKLLTDNGFYTSYVYQLVADGKIFIEGDTITKITRFHGLEEQIIDEGSVTTLVMNKVASGVPKNASFNSIESMEQRCEPETDSCSSEDYSSRNKVSTEFGTDETKYVLDKFGTYMQNMGPGKTFKNKKAIWQKISTKLLHKYGLDKTPQQVENRYKTVIRARKEVLTNNSKSGAAKKDMPKDMPFEEELRVIETLDDSIQPEILRSARHFKKLKPGNSTGKLKKIGKKNAPGNHADDTMTSSTSSTEASEDGPEKSNAINIKRQVRRKMHAIKQAKIEKKKIRHMSVAEAIIESTKIKEISRERRHKEKIKVLKQVHGKLNLDDSNSLESA